MAKVKGFVSIKIEYCKGCDLCVHECPQDTLVLSDKINQKGYRYAEMTNDTCTGCTNCALVCPEAIITVYRENLKKKSKSVEKIQTVSV
ncbi:MAG: ferredoxin family protein [Candidatus Marinimicrobia bacterium]|nr:ferredoxin family protein [Candidatus Neomarinimicrobiota bacterium]MBL7023086.1 ferredoxin family protein [Candidatus Neomarinimicrobiota bacterium]MBL7109106.1 ferredoxin family protein [Candidatus Neomarinimicrobiota bacterium]